MRLRLEGVPFVTGSRDQAIAPLISMPQLSLKNWHNILPVLVQIGIEMALAAIRSTVESRPRFKLDVRRG